MSIRVVALREVVRMAQFSASLRPVRKFTRHGPLALCA